MSMQNFVKISQPVDIKIVRFFKMAEFCHLVFVWGIFGPSTVRTWGLYHSTKFGYSRCRSFYYMNVSVFGAFGRKYLFTPPPKMFFWQFDPLNGLQY